MSRDQSRDREVAGEIRAPSSTERNLPAFQVPVRSIVLLRDQQREKGKAA